MNHHNWHWCPLLLCPDYRVFQSYAVACSAPRFLGGRDRPYEYFRDFDILINLQYYQAGGQCLQILEQEYS